MIFHVIGMGNGQPAFPAGVMELIAAHNLFSGGQRHYELVKHLLPPQHQWITIKAPLETLFEQYQMAGQSLVVFASGDPLFYGMANTLQQKYPAAQVFTYPYFSAVQLLVHRAGINSNNLKTVSVHGRDWSALDEALIRQDELIGVLTDKDKSPAAIAERMLDYGYSNYSLWIGEDLEGASEKVRHVTLTAARDSSFHPLNCILLQKETHRDSPFGIADSSFAGLEGRPNMITKMPVRLSSLHALDPGSKTVLWDMGFCTGSLSIEAKLRFPKLQVHAFEKRPECLQLMHQNQREHGAPGINAWIGDLFEFNFSEISSPDAVFIGGHGGRLRDLMELIDQYLRPGGTVVINAVQESSASEFIAVANSLGWKAGTSITLKVQQHNEITILKAIKGSE